jgi:hypothetical protein
MYTLRPNLLIAFHGCDRSVRDRLVLHPEKLRASTNSFDWLGSGMYFWENDPKRAMEWARQLKKHPQHNDQKIETPSVLGAVISLNHCLDLLDAESIGLVKEAHDEYLKLMKLTGLPLPQNKGGARILDCAVINYLHQMIADAHEKLDGLPPFDSVRAMFPEGQELYPGAGFRKQNHIQICIRNADCIKGLFIPRKPYGMLVE